MTLTIGIFILLALALAFYLLEPPKAQPTKKLTHDEAMDAVTRAYFQ